MAKAEVIYPNGERTQVYPINGTDFTLEEMKAFIGCRTVDIISVMGNKLLIIDDEGKLNDDCEVNEEATRIFMYGRLTHKKAIEEMRKNNPDVPVIDASEGIPEELLDKIVGTVIFCDRSMVQ